MGFRDFNLGFPRGADNDVESRTLQAESPGIPRNPRFSESQNLSESFPEINFSCILLNIGNIAIRILLSIITNTSTEISTEIIP